VLLTEFYGGATSTAGGASPDGEMLPTVNMVAAGAQAEDVAPVGGQRCYRESKWVVLAVWPAVLPATAAMLPSMANTTMLPSACSGADKQVNPQPPGP
jgi:hypothetical protein